MGNKKGLVWHLILFTDETKQDVFKVIDCCSIVEMSYYLNMKPQTISNFYHKLSKPKGILKCIGITQNVKL